MDRLVIEAGDNTFTLDLHPRLTVVAGMGQEERDSLIAEVIGSLGGSRNGVHVEIAERSGRHLAVFRPTDGRHRVVDVDHARDVTAELSDLSGACDLLARLGMSSQGASAAMRISPGDLAISSDRGQAVEVLAGLDQRRVWRAAEALHRAEGELAAEALAAGSAPEDAALMDLVEARHTDLERAADRFEATRRHTFAISGISAVATVPGVLAAGATGLGFLVVAAASVAASLRARVRLRRAAEAEQAALADAGVQSYLGFQLQRVNSLIGDDTSRRTLMGVAGNRRSALAEWHQLAGDIPVEWALENREEILAVASLRRGADALEAASRGDLSVTDDADQDLAHALIARLAEAHAVGGEGVPLLMDDPLHHLDSPLKRRLLELLGRSAGDPQVILLTDDPEVADWARLEAVAGVLSLIEPASEPSRTEDLAITL